MNVRGLSVAFLAVLVLGGAALGLARCERSAPTATPAGPLGIGREPRTLAFDVADEGAGMRSLQIELVHAGGASVLATRSWPGSLLFAGETRPTKERVEVPIDPRSLQLAEGPATLRVTLRDWSWSGVFAGNETVLELPCPIDLRPPRVSIENGQTYLQRGGSGLVVYSLNEDVTRDGVDVGGHFHPAQPFPGSDPAQRRRLVLFALPHDAPENPPIRVVAEDAAGNRSAQGWQTFFKERRFADVSLNLSPAFFANKVSELAASRGIQGTDLVAAFQTINREGREADEKRVRELTRESAPERLWEGAFEQLRNSKVTSQFAERRSYFKDGAKISEATHFGYDLAVVAAGPITASNTGRVVFADDLGIYGGCVILDHGLGLFSLYGHLSRIDVRPGDSVKKGQVVGLSGATGLAGGDHLHFAILLHDTWVDPVEWWDPKWIREKIDVLLPEPGAPASAPASAASSPAAATSPPAPASAAPGAPAASPVR